LRMVKSFFAMDNGLRRGDHRKCFATLQGKNSVVLDDTALPSAVGARNLRQFDFSRLAVALATFIIHS